MIIVKKVLSEVYVRSISTLWAMYLYPKKNVSIGKKSLLLQRLKVFGSGSLKIGTSSVIGAPRGGGFYRSISEIIFSSCRAKLEIGNNFACNNSLTIYCKGQISIGNDVLIGRNVIIMDHNGHEISPASRRLSSGKPHNICIGNNVWIGHNVIVLPGTTIGDNSIVGAGVVLSGSVPANSIVKMQPPKIVYIDKAVL